MSLNRSYQIYPYEDQDFQYKHLLSIEIQGMIADREEEDAFFFSLMNSFSRRVLKSQNVSYGEKILKTAMVENWKIVLDYLYLILPCYCFWNILFQNNTVTEGGGQKVEEDFVCYSLSSFVVPFQ